MTNNIFKDAKEVDIFCDLSAAKKVEASIIAQVAICVHNKREQMCMTQAEFAKALNVSQTMVSKWESGDYDFTINELSELFAALGLQMLIYDSSQLENILPTSAKCCQLSGIAEHMINTQKEGQP